MKKNEIYLSLCKAYKESSLYRFIDKVYEIADRVRVPIVRLIVNAYIDGIVLAIGYTEFYTLTHKQQEVVKDRVMDLVIEYLMRHADAESS